MLREEDIAVRRAIVNRKPGHADWQHARMPGRRSIPPERLAADPLDRPWTIGGDDFSADRKVLDGDLTARSQNLRSPRKAAYAARA